LAGASLPAKVISYAPSPVVEPCWAAQVWETSALADAVKMSASVRLSRAAAEATFPLIIRFTGFFRPDAARLSCD
jgi:hypothetical protein